MPTYGQSQTVDPYAQYNRQQSQQYGNNNSWGGYGQNEMLDPNDWYTQQQQNRTPAFDQWSQQGYDPNNPYGQSYYNQMTGERSRQGPTGLIVGGGRGTADGQFASYLDESGNRVINPGALFGAFGGSDVGINRGDSSPYQVTPFSGQGYQAGAAWNPNLVDSGQITDTTDVINSFKPQFEEQIGQGFADAGARMGKSGFAASTPYANELGQVERSALDDLSNVSHQYLYNAAESQANRDLQAQQQNSAQDLAAWQTQSGYGHQGQMADQDRDLAAWQGGQQMGLGAWQAGQQNDLGWGQLDMQAQLANQQQQSQQQQLMMQLMGGMF